MSLVDSITRGFQKHFDKKNEEREMMEKMQHEVKLQKLQIFQEEFRRNALEVATAQAKKEAAEKSGLQKLRATNRFRNLKNNSNRPEPGSFFSNMGEYMQKNIARREENLSKTKELKKVAENLKEKRKNTFTQKNNRPPPFAKSTWKM